jgi:hypothetical protein
MPTTRPVDAVAIKRLTCALLMSLTTLPTLAAPLSPECRKVAEASLKRLDAPRFHLSASMQGETMETVKDGDRVVMRDSPTAKWQPVPMGTAGMKRAAQQTQAWLVKCERVGAGETIEGAVTEIYRFTVKSPAGSDGDNRVWIGRDNGLPYREEGGPVRNTTRYNSVPRLP